MDGRRVYRQAGSPGRGRFRFWRRRKRETGMRLRAAFRRLRTGRARTRANTMDTARNRLRAFRQSTILAVALTGLLLLIFAPGDAQESDIDPVAGMATAESAGDGSVSPEEEMQPLGEAAQEEALTAARNLWEGFVFNLPKVLVVAGLLVLAWLLARLLRVMILRLFGKWERGSAISALVMIGFWLMVLGIAVSILAGDFRALVGSLGLVGLALSWALQTPIESFTGWLLNSFRGYYRVGDRIAVGDIFGDVFNIDVLTTTLWEIGGPDRPPGQIHAEQPTGRLISFPNNEILTGTVVNLTRDFPYVWDELQVPVANESDLAYALPVLEKIAVDLLGKEMKKPAHRYETILKESNLAFSVPDRPQLFVSLADSWVDITIRYLVNVRERRPWQSELTRLIIAELNKPEHAGKIIPTYHRRQVQILDDGGRPRTLGESDPSEERADAERQTGWSGRKACLVGSAFQEMGPASRPSRDHRQLYPARTRQYGAESSGRRFRRSETPDRGCGEAQGDPSCKDRNLFGSRSSGHLP